MTTRRTALALGALAVGLLAGCTDPSPGADDTAQASASASPSPMESASDEPAEDVANDADIAFANAVLGYHEQSLQMHQIIETKAGVSPDVVALAGGLFNWQSAQREELTLLLRAWDVEPTPTVGAAPLPGTLTAEQMSQLATADAPTATVLYLEGMIGHHEATIALAEEEAAEGSDPEAVAVARDMIAAQEQRLTDLRRLLAEAGPDVATSGPTAEA